MLDDKNQYLESNYTPQERWAHREVIHRWLAGEVSQHAVDKAILGSRPASPPRQTNYMRETPLCLCGKEDIPGHDCGTRIHPDPRRPELYYERR
jgi:hypothetical protein